MSRKKIRKTKEHNFKIVYANVEQLASVTDSKRREQKIIVCNACGQSQSSLIGSCFGCGIKFK